MSAKNRRRQVDAVLRFFASQGNRARFWRLVEVVRAQTNLLSPQRYLARGAAQTRVARACSHLAAASTAWHREPESWCNDGGDSEYGQWDGLVGHLLNGYPAPAFFSKSWLDPFQQPWQRQFHRHVGNGLSPRKFSIPSIGRMSKGTARALMGAPVDATVEEAIRWAQVRALGGDVRLARYLMSRVCLLDRPGWEECWQSVFHFLVCNQPISLQEVGEILLFVNEQRFEPSRRTVGLWMNEQPVDNELLLWGWSLRRLRRRMAHWRDAFPTPAEAGQVGWYESGYRPLEMRSGELEFRIVELLTPRSLFIEGRSMRHCVATYAPYCQRGESSIWSLRMYRGKRCKRVATIELWGSPRCVWQVKGRYNSEPKPLAKQLIRNWAEREGIAVGVLAE